MRVGSLFAGIGGFDLAARNVGWSTAWYSEIDPYACRVMAKHFPDALNLGDITTITNPPAVDVLCGGFPCQDISYAGDGAGIAAGTRSGLWYQYARLIAEVPPRWVVAENVSALRTRGLDTVLRQLDALGYDTEWHCIPASAVGAPHERDRLWIVAHADGEHGRERGSESGRARLANWHQTRHGSAAVSDAMRPRLEGQRTITSRVAAQMDDAGNVRRWPPEPRVGRVAHGVPARVDRIRCLGNAIVPQVAEVLFRAINDAEGMTPTPIAARRQEQADHGD